MCDISLNWNAEISSSYEYQQKGVIVERSLHHSEQLRRLGPGSLVAIESQISQQKRKLNNFQKSTILDFGD